MSAPSDSADIKRAAEILRETASRAWDIFIASAAPNRHDEYLALAKRLDMMLAAPAAPPPRLTGDELIAALEREFKRAPLTTVLRDAALELARLKERLAEAQKADGAAYRLAAALTRLHENDGGMINRDGAMSLVQTWRFEHDAAFSIALDADKQT